MVAAMLVEEGNVADLEADAARVGLEAVLLKMPPSMTQLAHANQHAILHLVPFALAPEALVTQLLVGPVPWTVDGGLNMADVPGIESGRGGGEVMGDVTTEAAIGVCVRQAASRL